MYKKIQVFLLASLVTVLFIGTRVLAAENQPVNYPEGVVVDSDLDGLTDEGEIQIYKTDPQQTDTDADGHSDSIEILTGSDPLNKDSYIGATEPVITENEQVVSGADIPWAWYVTRASGLIAFLLLYISIFLGLTLGIPLLRKIFLPVYSMRIHCWISLQATLFALIHGGALLFDKAFKFSLLDVFIPFASEYQPNLVALGILGFYLMVILVLTSYGRKFISQKIWRITHFTNIVLYGAVFVHALYLGTDLKNEFSSSVFILANALLVILMLFSIEIRIKNAYLRKRELVNDQSKIQ